MPFCKTANETAGLFVRAAVLVQARQGLEHRLDEFLAEFFRRPLLEFTQVQYVTDDAEMGEDIRPNVDVGADDFHSCSPSSIPELRFG